MTRRWKRSRLALGVALVAAALAVYATRWWPQEQLPLQSSPLPMDELWPVLRVAAAVALLLGGSGLIASAWPDQERERGGEAEPHDDAGPEAMP